MKERRQPRFRKTCWIFLAGLFFLWARSAGAQQPASSTTPAPPPSLPQEGIFLVFPFENAGAPLNLDWIGEGLEELTIQRLSAAGQQVYSHAGRLNEMDRYGLPASAKLSRATMLRIAEDLDADYIVFGNFASDGKTLSVETRLLRVSPVALLPVIRESGPLGAVMEIHAKMSWDLLRSCDRNYAPSFPDFTKMQQALSLAAFEQYVRGLLANDDETRLRYLKEAAQLEPEWAEPAFAIGEVYFQRNDCSAALPWYAKVPPTHARGVEANFAAGVCRLRLGQPEKAEEVFGQLEESLHRNLPAEVELPEILNNLGIARARAGNFPPAQTALGRARDIDPDEDDYPFNLGLLALQQKDLATAATHFDEAVKRERDNPENLAFLIFTLEKLGRKADAAAQRESATEALGEEGVPTLKLDLKHPDSLRTYERIKTVLDLTSLRLELEGPQMQQIAVSDPAVPRDAAVTHIRLGRQEFRAGRLDAAEQEFRAALATEPNNASAHSELAEIYHRRGKLEDAAHELQLSLDARDSAAVRTFLARVYLEQKKPELARAEAEKAIKVAPNYPEARELLDHLAKSKPTGGAK